MSLRRAAAAGRFFNWHAEWGIEKDQGLTQLIGDIYDAALDASRWTSVLAKISVYVGGQAAGLLSKDAVSKSGSVHYQVGVDPYFVQLYSETYWKHDPVSRNYPIAT